MDAGSTAEDKGAEWVQKVVGWSAEIVRHPPKLVPEEVMRAWVRECKSKEGVPIDSEKLMEEKGPEALLTEEMDSGADLP